MAESIADALKAHGIKVVAFEFLTPGETDYSAVLTNIAALMPEAVFFGGYQPEAAVLARQKNMVGLSSVSFVSGDGVYGSEFFNLAGSHAEGYYVLRRMDISSSGARAKFDEAYLAEYGTEPGSLSDYSWSAYDATMILIRAIGKVAIQVNDTVYVPRKALMEAVRGTNHYTGLTGTITCDTNGDCRAASSFSVFQVQNGTFVQLPANYKP